MSENRLLGVALHCSIIMFLVEHGHDSLRVIYVDVHPPEFEVPYNVQYYI